MGEMGVGYALEEKDGKFQKFVQAFVYILKLQWVAYTTWNIYFADEGRGETGYNTCFTFTTRSIYIMMFVLYCAS